MIFARVTTTAAVIAGVAAGHGGFIRDLLDLVFLGGPAKTSTEQISMMEMRRKGVSIRKKTNTYLKVLKNDMIKEELDEIKRMDGILKSCALCCGNYR